MSSFFGTSGSGSGSNANKPPSTSNASGTGSSNGGAGGGWGTFLKQGLSTIESKLDAVLDIQVPIPGGSAGTLTSFSPHASVLPSSITGSSDIKDTPPKKQPPLKAPSFGGGSGGQQGDSGQSMESLQKGDDQDPRNSISVRGTVDGAKVNRSSTSSGKREEETSVTVDPFTGMITTTSEIKRISTPPVSGGSTPSSLAASASSTLNAAAAAAAANRERLEQRMRGIFKKVTDSPPAIPSPTASPSPSVRHSMTVDLEEKDSGKLGLGKADPLASMLPSTTEEKREVKDSLDDSKKTFKNGSEATSHEPSLTISMAEQEDANDVHATRDVVSEVEKEDVSEELVTKDADVCTATDFKKEQELNTTTVAKGKVAEEAAVKSEGKDGVVDGSSDSESTAGIVDEINTQASVEESEGMIQESVGKDTLQDTLIATSKSGEDIEEQEESATSRTSVDSKKSVSDLTSSLTDHPYTPTSTTETSLAPSTIGLVTKNDNVSSQSTSMEGSSNTDTDDNPLKRVLEQREEQLFKAMQEQSSLLERIRDLEDAKAADETLKATKIAGLEKIIATQRKELEAARGSNLTSQPRSIQKTLEEQRVLLEDKDEQIRGLLAEGEVLSKKEFKHLTAIKSMRTKSIEAEKLQVDTQKKLDKALSDHAELQIRLNKLTEENKQLHDSVKTLHDINQRQNKQTAKMETELTQLKSDKANLQLGLDRAWQELAEARKASAELSNQAHTAALEREMKLNEDLSNEMGALKTQHAVIESNLRQDIQELRVSLSNREELAGEKEDQLLMEIRNLQARLEQTDSDSYELQEALNEARRPLLRQIEILQNQHSIANRNWDKVEKSLNRRVAEAEEDVTKAQERERITRDKVVELKSQIIALEARLETLRIADTQLRSEVNVSKRMLIDKEEETQRAQAELARERVSRERAVEEAKDDIERKLRLQQQAEIDQLKLQIQQLQKQQQHRQGNNETISSDAHLNADAIAAAAATVGRPSSASSMLLGGGPVVMGGAKSGLQEAGNSAVRPSFDSMASSSSLDGMPLALSRTNSFQTMSGTLMGLGNNATGQAVALERLHTMVRQLEGQVTFLSEQVRSANRNKDELSDELVRVTIELEELQKQAARVPGLEQELGLLQERHRAALEMLGERTEEVQELKADLQDVKEAFRDQNKTVLVAATPAQTPYPSMDGPCTANMISKQQKQARDAETSHGLIAKAVAGPQNDPYFL
ncbi:hypothetical protein EDD11_002209 [Mortierella claussenii]|nr:hypothetical protein EDD11_002209 [Mortierella claussenii]